MKLLLLISSVCVVLSERVDYSLLFRKFDRLRKLNTVAESTGQRSHKPSGVSLRWYDDIVSPRRTNQDVYEMSQTNKYTCGYQACNLGNADALNVHMVAHTHDDVGWEKTVDQYYYGARNDIRHAGVQYILDTVIDELLKDSQKRFIYVEIAFFYRWWQEQNDAYRHRVKGLVNQGRLEFILGGWSMNDEATTHYNAIIDQHTVGFRFIQQNFGDCGRPKIGWQIDPFGHSREQASLFAQFGFDGLFFGRLDYQDKAKRMRDRTMEHLWLGSQNLGDSAVLFTGAMPDEYHPPFSIHPLVPIMDNPNLDDYNVDAKVKDFIRAAKTQAKHFTTNHIMFTMGSDFWFENAHEDFKNLDKTIKYVNQKTEDSGVNVIYSTPSCYLYALNQANQTYTTKSDDFFPYASRPHSFWTGYFTSRPALKNYVRATNNFLQVCKQLDVLAKLGPQYGSAIKLDLLRHAMGVAQHHDAVSGTEKQHVADDYAKRLSRGVHACQEVVNYAYANILPLTGSKPGPDRVFCPLLNASYCQITETTDKFTALLYNPIGRQVSFWAQLPVSGVEYDVLDSDLKPVKSQLIPLSAATMHLPDHNGSHASAMLVFKTVLPPLGFSTYFITKPAVNSNLPVHMLGESSVTRESSRTLRLKCDVPSRSVNWYKDGEVIHEDHHTTIRSTKLRRISLRDSDDSGRYHCETVIDGLRWVQYWNVEVTSPDGQPNAPHHLVASNITNTSAWLSWKHEGTPGVEIVGYSVHYYQKGIELQRVTNRHSFYFDNLVSGGDYHVYVMAYSRSGVSQRSETLDLNLLGPGENVRRRKSLRDDDDDDDDEIIINNEHMVLTFKKSTGMLGYVTPVGSTDPIPVRQSILYYPSYNGNNSKPEFQASGAYVFRPNVSQPVSLTKHQAKITVIKGDLVHEVQQVFSDWATQTIRLYKGAQYAEFEWTVGPIPINDGIGKEVISRFTTDLETKGEVYTDSNGREILKRMRDYRPTWKLNQTEPIAGNYYPVNSRIYIKDEQKDLQLTILTDRSQGGASIHDGEIELMVHRRLLVDDNFGVGEALNEHGITGKGLVVRGKHYVLLSSISQAASLHRNMAEKLYMAPSISFQSLEVSPHKYETLYRTEWHGLSTALPDNVHLLTLEEWEENSFLLRLEHFYERNEDTILSQNATVHLRDLFVPFHISSVDELTLGGNQKLADAQRLIWTMQGHGRTNGNMKSFVAPVDPMKLAVTLKPMQIRTFQVFYE